MDCMRKHIKKIILVVIIIMLATVGAVVWATETAFNEDTVINFSPNYDLSWNKYLGQATLKKDNKVISQFNFRPRPLAVWIYKPTNVLAIVTSDDGQVDGAHGLYIYNGKEVKKVYQTKRQTIGNNVKIKEGMYDFSYSEQERNVRYVLNFSPDGKYLYVPIFGYEGSGSISVSIEDLKVVGDIDDQTQINAAGEVYFSPDGNCVVNIRHYYGDGDDISLGKKGKESGNYELKTTDNGKLFGSTINGIYWSENCKGIVSVRTNDTSTDYFSFDTENYRLTKLNYEPNVSNMLNSLKVPQENIFYTIKGNYHI